MLLVPELIRDLIVIPPTMTTLVLAVKLSLIVDEGKVTPLVILVINKAELAPEI